ncbi:MAG: hypothetical protein ABSD85_10235 [Acidimicrobiales bacterium]|jgi:hypothetical protein
MSDEHEFAKIAESLRKEGFGSRAILLDRLRRGLALIAGCVCLLAMAVLLALTNTMSVLITLTVVGMVLYQLALVGLREHRREAV